MTTLLELPVECHVVESRLRGDQEIGAAVRSLLGNTQQRITVERRREHRFPFPYPIRLTPMTTDGTVSPAESVVVLGKHLNEHGVDFYYTEPLPYRRAIASFERGGQEVVHIVMDLTWCRFGRHGWYENGGHFLHLLSGGSGHAIESILPRESA
jgi:hypothetical protein